MVAIWQGELAALTIAKRVFRSVISPPGAARGPSQEICLTCTLCGPARVTFVVSLDILPPALFCKECGFDEAESRGKKGCSFLKKRTKKLLTV
jgi:hypothetical protein